MEKLCVQERPNGRVYRARKPPTLHAFEGDWPDDNCVMVLRVDQEGHDVARDMVIAQKAHWGYEMVGKGSFGWWRETIRNSEPYWDYDSDRGMPGWYFPVE